MGEDHKEEPSLASLEAQLEALKKSQPPKAVQSPSNDATRAATDFVSACAAGSLLGFGADSYLESSPWGLIIGLFVGVAAGFRMLMRIGTKTSTPERDK